MNPSADAGASEPLRLRRDELARERELALRATPDTMIFRETPANRFVDSAEDRLSTFALDVDTGSYTLTRGYLERGLLPPPAAIRVEEFVNAQSYDDPAPVRRARRLRALRRGGPGSLLPRRAHPPAALLRQGARDRRARQEARRPHLRRRRLGLDEPGEPPRAGEARARPAARRARPGRSGWPGGLRHQRPRPAAPHAGSRRDPACDRRAPSRGLDQRRRGSAPRLRPRRRGLAAGGEQPHPAVLRRRRQRRRDGAGVDPGAHRQGGAARHRPHHRSASAWATTTTP